MTNRIHDAVVAAIKDPQVSGALAEIAQKAILDANQKSYDPYRTTIHFLIALIAFCLSVIVGLFNALPDPPVCTYTLTYHMLGGVLAWISITAFVASVCAAVAQYLKHLYRVEQLRRCTGPDCPQGAAHRSHGPAHLARGIRRHLLCRGRPGHPERQPGTAQKPVRDLQALAILNRHDNADAGRFSGRLSPEAGGRTPS